MNSPRSTMPSLQNPPNINAAVSVKTGPNYPENVQKPDAKKKASLPAGTTGSMSQDALHDAAIAKMKAGHNTYEREQHMSKVSGGYMASMMGNGTKR